jgi:hypothetical protein
MCVLFTNPPGSEPTGVTVGNQTTIGTQTDHFEMVFLERSHFDALVAFGTYARRLVNSEGQMDEDPADENVFYLFYEKFANLYII